MGKERLRIKIWFGEKFVEKKYLGGKKWAETLSKGAFNASVFSKDNSSCFILY